VVLIVTLPPLQGWLSLTLNAGVVGCAVTVTLAEAGCDGQPCGLNTVST
jgi:hypothetical protein